MPSTNKSRVLQLYQRLMLEVVRGKEHQSIWFLKTKLMKMNYNKIHYLNTNLDISYLLSVQISKSFSIFSLPFHYAWHNPILPSAMKQWWSHIGLRVGNCSPSRLIKLYNGLENLNFLSLHHICTPWIS